MFLAFLGCFWRDQDSDERACANIGGGAPNRWGKGDKYHQEAGFGTGSTVEKPVVDESTSALYWKEAWNQILATFQQVLSGGRIRMGTSWKLHSSVHRAR